MTGPKSFEGGMGQSRQKQLDKKKELEKKEELEKSSDKIKADKEAGKRLDELARPKMSLTDQLRATRQKGTEIGESAKLPTPSERYDYHEGLHDLPKEILEHTGIDMAGEALASLEMIALAKIAIDYGRKLLEGIGELHDKNIREAKARGFRDGLDELGRDRKDISNPHIQEGKPYTRRELIDRIQRRNPDWFRDRAFEGVEASNALKGYESSIDTLVNTINPVLNQAKTPGQRLTILDTFVASAYESIRKQANVRGK